METKRPQYPGKSECAREHEYDAMNYYICRARAKIGDVNMFLLSAVLGVGILAFGGSAIFGAVDFYKCLTDRENSIVNPSSGTNQNSVSELAEIVGGRD